MSQKRAERARMLPSGSAGQVWSVSNLCIPARRMLPYCAKLGQQVKTVIMTKAVSRCPARLRVRYKRT